MRPDIFHGSLPSIAGTKSGPLLIVGPGWNLKTDLELVPDFKGDIMAVNAAGMFLKRIDHWYTPHPEYSEAMNRLRCFFHLPLYAGPIHSAQGARGQTVTWPIKGTAAASGGIQATVVGCEMGYAPILLCGMPADGKGHFYPHPPENGWDVDYDHGQNMFLTQWVWLRDNYFAGRVKSLSGYTKEILS